MFSYSASDMLGLTLFRQILVLYIWLSAWKLKLCLWDLNNRFDLQSGGSPQFRYCQLSSTYQVPIAGIQLPAPVERLSLFLKMSLMWMSIIWPASLLDLACFFSILFTSCQVGVQPSEELGLIDLPPKAIQPVDPAHHEIPDSCKGSAAG